MVRYGDPRIRKLVEDALPPLPRLQDSVLGCTVYRDIGHVMVASLGDKDTTTLGLVYGIVRLHTL